MNRKGQSLVLFVLVIPIVTLVILAVYKIGRLAILNEELSNINYMTIDYGLDHLSEPDLTTKLHNMITKNKSDLENINIDIEDNKITITLESKMDLVDVKSSYIGYFDEDKKIIEKNK